jgi:hypothetical protein
MDMWFDAHMIWRMNMEQGYGYDIVEALQYREEVYLFKHWHKKCST